MFLSYLRCAQKGYGAFVTDTGALGSKFQGIVTELATSMASDRGQPVSEIMIECAARTLGGHDVLADSCCARHTDCDRLSSTCHAPASIPDSLSLRRMLYMAQG